MVKNVLLGLAIVIVLGAAYLLPGRSFVLHEIPENARTLVLSAHFDDAVLSLGGLLNQEGNRATVATFFTKADDSLYEAEWDTMSGFKESREAIASRTDENQRALQLFGANIKNYRYNDLQYEENRKDKETLAALVSDIRNLITQYSGQVLIYGPAKFQQGIGNPDHHLLHEAFVEVAKQLSEQENVFFFIYEDYPYIEKSDMSVQRLKNFLEKGSKLDLQPELVQLTENDLIRKIDSLRKYDSQVKAFTALGEDLIGGADKFSRRRCEDFLCEVVYKIK